MWAARAPSPPLPLAASLQQEGGHGPGEPGLSRTCCHWHCPPGRPTPASAAPGIFKALHCQELITGCAAAASSAVYIISRFLAFALLLIYRRHLLTPSNPWMITLVVPSTQQKPWHPQPDGVVWGTVQSTEMGIEQKKMSGEAGPEKGHLPQHCRTLYTSHASTAGGGSQDSHICPSSCRFLNDLMSQASPVSPVLPFTLPIAQPCLPASPEAVPWLVLPGHCSPSPPAQGDTGFPALSSVLHSAVPGFLLPLLWYPWVLKAKKKKMTVS